MGTRPGMQLFLLIKVDSVRRKSGLQEISSFSSLFRGLVKNEKQFEIISTTRMQHDPVLYWAGVLAEIFVC